MTISVYLASATIFHQLLESLEHISAKAEQHAGDDPRALLQARLFPDMFPFVRQIQIACDFAKGACARLAGVDVPKYEHVDEGFPELAHRIAKTRAFIDSLPASRIHQGAERMIVLRPGEDGFDQAGPAAMRGDVYLVQFAVPQFFFHVTTAYAILRHVGVPLGKMDYLGRFR